ncbi:acyl carrier protein, partial [Ascoidea rubescens DSM 1968]
SSLTKDDVSKRVYDVIKSFEKTKDIEISNELNFATDLGLDSLDVVEVLVAIEEEFDFEIPDNDADEIKSVGQVIEYIVNHPEAN